MRDLTSFSRHRDQTQTSRSVPSCRRCCSERGVPRQGNGTPLSAIRSGSLVEPSHLPRMVMLSLPTRVVSCQTSSIASCQPRSRARAVSQFSRANHPEDRAVVYLRLEARDLRSCFCLVEVSVSYIYPEGGSRLFHLTRSSVCGRIEVSGILPLTSERRK